MNGESDVYDGEVARMKHTFLVAAFLISLGACSTPDVFTPGSEEQLEYDADALSEHSDRLDSYRDWLEDAWEELADRQEEIEDLIDDLNGLNPKTVLESEYQHQLHHDMMVMNQQFVGLQQAIQNESSAYAVLLNIIKVRNQTTKDAIKNIR